ncbi:DUF3710 domain-containing protein [Brachybacterium sp. MASK1Z-5]|uniref:DUF3710 domain-containing protein n=1 Tax=Brachybacterium halotolerans TaxID=2795215 RepID=A0ABS1B5H0_9MICO|nr:DUF3710 domain-containing protein [Brachybacterium halotolerans]MBK0329889.1 DUF3710 domain-containing protein [Brachybacterium halotolerans]
MGLFSRKDTSKVTAKASDEDTAEGTAADTRRGAAKDEDAAEQARPTGATDDDASTTASGDAASDTTSDPDEATSSTRESATADGALGGDHLEDGPLDAADAPEEDRIDLGGLLVPMVEGMELRMEMDQRTRAVTGANLVIEGSSLQVQAFAAPKSRALWDEVRTSLRGSVVEQGGTAETRPGPFGTELIARLPVKRSDGRVGYRPARFIGVDGPRWLLRAILSGPALGDAEASRAFETLISRIVVVRGSDAMAPQELIPLNLPGQRPGLVPAEDTTLNPLERGPEITEIG